ncbi:hypothetical protein L9F63_014464 [Diploptera punctata]|uniref:Uncharacterized protein n=1 Tax=Diploptera punctata TaxID=6984 RepID=A0AAD8AA29_DIPPU|nr:hypothetical protein L9F63_014464 [Diploptera punctata]
MQQPPQLDVRLEDNGTHPYLNPSASTFSPSDTNPEQDNTVTFLIGFGILILFVIAGIMASVFLCVTLKKDPYLWEAVFDGAKELFLKMQGHNTASTSVSNKKYNEDVGICSTISVDNYTVECHRNADAIL